MVHFHFWSSGATEQVVQQRSQERKVAGSLVPVQACKSLAAYAIPHLLCSSGFHLHFTTAGVKDGQETL